MALQAFCDKIRANKYFNLWNTPKDLAGSVCLSMMSVIELNPRPGWMPGDRVQEDVAQEILTLTHKVTDLQRELDLLGTRPPPNAGKPFTR
jgi:hypothetical protein